MSSQKNIKTPKVIPSAMKEGAGLMAGEMGVALQGQKFSPAINYSQFSQQGVPALNALITDPQEQIQANVGVKGLYKPIPDDWFWSNWYRNAQGRGMQEGGVIPKLGKVIVPEQFWNWAQAKQEQSFEEQFNRFIFNQVDVTRPENRAYWEKKFPGYMQKVYDAYAMKAQIEAKVAEIQIKGAQTMQDFYFMYLYELGYFYRQLGNLEINQETRIPPVEDNIFANQAVPGVATWPPATAPQISSAQPGGVLRLGQ